MKFKGYTLIEIMLVITIVSGLAMLDMMKIKRQAEAQESEKAGQEMKLVMDGLIKWASNKINVLQPMNDPGHPMDVVPGICTPVVTDPANLCKLNLNVLRQENIMPMMWVGRNETIKSDYTAYIRRVLPAGAEVGVTPYYNLEVMLMVNDPWLDRPGGNIEWKKLMGAAQSAGVKVGVVQEGVASGNHGAWSLNAGEFPGMQNGQLVGYGFIQGQMAAQYVYLDGSLGMRGSLDMGGNRINNADDLELKGPDTLPKNNWVSRMASNWILKNVYSVNDYDFNSVTGSVPMPVCADAEETGATPKILIKPTALYNETFDGSLPSGNADGDPGKDWKDAVGKKQSATGGWNIFATPDNQNKKWNIYIRRYYDNGFIPGEGLAEVYCYYP